MGLGDGERDAVAFPDFRQQRRDAGGRGRERARGLDVGAGHAVGRAAVVRRVALRTVIEPALAGDVVIDADDVGRAGILAEPQELVGRDAGPGQVVPQRVLGADHAAQQVPRQPAALVVELGHVRQLGRAVGFTEVVGLDQLGVGIDGADRAHRQHHRAALVQQRLDEGAVVAPVRIPDAVQAGEAGRGAGFVDRGVVLEPGVARRDRAGVFGQLFGKVRVDQAGVARTAAVVDQAGDRGDAGIAQRVEALVRPGPVGLFDAVRGGALPDHRIADRADAEGCEAFDVVRASCVAVAIELVEVGVLNAVDGAFEAAPEFERAELAVRALR